MSDAEWRHLRLTADYQWGAGAGRALFPEADVEVDALNVTHTSSGRPRQVIGPDGRLVTFGTDGRFRLGLAGGHRLLAARGPERYAVAVGDESEPFVREGRNTFAKFVVRADPDIRPGDEVLLVHAEGGLLAVGRAELDGVGMGDFATGVAVTVREGNDGD